MSTEPKIEQATEEKPGNPDTDTGNETGQDFIASANFDGARPGYVYRGVGRLGPGYYKDTGSQMSVSNSDTSIDEPTEEERRFLVELEFVQYLANPDYLHFLAQHGYFEKPAFVNYLEYLLYWQQPQYAKHIKYPHGLFFLQQVQQEDYRIRLRDPNFIKSAQMQQYRHWLGNQPTKKSRHIEHA